MPRKLDPWEEVIGELQDITERENEKSVTIENSSILVKTDLDIPAETGDQVFFLKTGEGHRIRGANDEK